MKNKNLIIENIVLGLEKQIGPIATLKRLADVAHSYSISEEQEEFEITKSILLSNLKKKYAPLKTDRYILPEFPIFTKLQSIDIFFLSIAFSYNHTYSHFSALFLNGLINQRPADVYLSKYTMEKRPFNNSNSNMDESSLKMFFRKSPRITSKIIQFKKNDILFIEKTKNEKKFIENISINSNNILCDITVTEKHKTIIDCIISPQYAGGIITVLQALKKFEDIDIRFLSDIYEDMSPVYPYWQNIGFLLEKSHGKEKAQSWLDQINKTSHKFYLQKGYTDDWIYDEKWKLYHPNIF